MRRPRRVGAAVLLAVGLAACDSSQPDQLQQQTASFVVSAVGAQALVFDVWEYIRDDNADQQPDDGRVYLWCERNQMAALPPVSVPWPFSIEINRIRSGSTEIERISLPAARSATGNVALYDTAAIVGVTPAIPSRFAPTAVGGVVTIGTMRFRFLPNRARQNTAAHEAVMTQTSNPLAAVAPPPAPTYGQGICSVGNPGPPSINLAPPPFVLTLEKGDTIIVNALPAAMAPSGTGLNQAIVQRPPGQFGLFVRFQVDGQPVTAVGTVSGPSVSFSYTAR